MNPSRSRSSGSGEEISFQENERRWQQERLHREEAYYQFINELSDEDYRLMRDHNLLGTPGEITSEELQQRLDRAKEQLASQPGSRSGTSDGDSENLRENSDEDSLLRWLNTFRRTGNVTRSGQNGNQSWRAVSRTNPNSGEFGFSLEIHINPDNRGSEPHGEDYTDTPLSGVRDRRQQRSSSPVAMRTRSQTSLSSNGRDSSGPGGRRGARGQGSARGAFSARGRLRNGIGGALGVPRVSGHRTNVIGTHTNQSDGSNLRQRERQRFGAAHIWENGARSNVTVRNTNQRLEPLRLRPAFSSRSRSPIQRQDATVYHNSQRQTGRVRSVRHRGVTQVFLEQDRARRGTVYMPLSNSRLVSRITVEEGESSRSSAATQRHPAITLDLQVRRIRPGETRDRDSIANRTRSRAGLAESTVESNSGGFHRTISHLERSGVRTYVSTITVPLRRISENEVVEPSSVALRSILRQIMTGFGELSSLMEVEPESENQRSGQRLPELYLELNNMDVANNSTQQGGGSSQARQAQDVSAEMLDVSEPASPQVRNGGNRNRRQLRRADSVVEAGTLPILRLAHFFLLNEGDDDPIRGLTKEQIDNLSTRSYEQNGVDSELGKVCSVCISDYVAGNKLRQLPCLHEFHIHCIDRWLSENCTCPVCRQPVLEFGAANNG
ncbi:E3 ubiquitin-protein ligase RNF6 [Cricetulus griseus]|uniref:RING-type E3 ubiquitin transferase n=1 Tax=Cricetulus griseus TaxID=10029 RepID=G3GWJ4_CRIGR|nr:E3 ubiquitin-protein ligase RNF6 [Cricetulus griseus]XP_027269462.1 E3 ubiquitin-protein ligase RNF6 [Cricetulus griseus]XP_027269463.1 E3 ubiquitin-protein ligase RNF6 [Cricetulus griseus]XP_035292723.1 E3 ubiquitin-protein ligase RNF6 [Cricetulus griseus]EGV93382.1 RING finger protein 6 [Cricetulus griseus]ERE76060.1 E3 ubiquitin-protein ligase [Cricetulus griseus]